MQGCSPTHAVVLMGVSGSGKSTVGNLLAKSLGCSFLDADDFHSQENKEKMKQGIPLTDSDRWPWLESLRDTLIDHIMHGRTVVLACSALKPAFRHLLRTADLERMQDLQPRVDGRKEEICLSQKKAYLASKNGKKMDLKSHKLIFLLLKGPAELFAWRLHERSQQGAHFMPPSLLSSQLDALNINENEDDIFQLDASLSPAAIVHYASEIIGQQA